ncbi:MAG TPA: CPBP family intramembrane glutamic endopeptidase [Allosphingosinicella sp.]|nr:CPBP family intramembrane glutamic endopeptidase [Allosphingosinicella sp.]
MLIPAFLLIAVLALLGWFVRNDGKEYERFKALTRTEDRQRAFRRWTIKSFFLFSGASFAVLLLIGRLDTLVHFPAEFVGLSRMLSDGPDGFGLGLVLGLVGALFVGIPIGMAFRSRLLRGRPTPRPQKLLGDIAPLLPRSRDERKWTALLGTNAGLGEELFFRLMLPLLIVEVGGGAILAFVAAGLIFGLVHFYQGWVGIAATTVIGFVFAGLYLASGTIWAPVILHALMNLNSLWLQPLLSERRTRAAA